MYNGFLMSFYTRQGVHWLHPVGRCFFLSDRCVNDYHNPELTNTASRDTKTVTQNKSNPYVRNISNNDEHKYLCDPLPEISRTNTRSQCRERRFSICRSKISIFGFSSKSGASGNFLFENTISMVKCDVLCQFQAF